MEIAKFVITCVLAAITVGGTFAGIFKAYTKKMDDKIRAVKADAEAQVQNADAQVQEAKADAEKKIQAAKAAAEKGDEMLRRDFGDRITKLESDVSELQKTINGDIRDRLGNIEGEMKGMNNILKSIQNWFIDHTPCG